MIMFQYIGRGCTSDKITAVLGGFIRTCIYFRQNCCFASPFCPNLYLLQTKCRLGFPVLSEPLPTSDKMPAGLPRFVRTCTYFRQNCCFASPFCPNLYLLQTKCRLGFPFLSEPLPTSDKMPAGLPRFVRTLYLLQTKLLLCLSPVLSEPLPTSDKMPAGLPRFVRTCTYFRQNSCFASPFCPNLYLLQTKCRLGFPVLSEPRTYFRQNCCCASPFCPNFDLLQKKSQLGLLVLSEPVPTSDNPQAKSSNSA